MNQLETLIIPTETVDFNGQTLEVRGLGLADITFVVRHHRDLLNDLYTQAIAGRLSGSVEEIAITLVDEFVPLAAMVIAAGTGDVKQAPKAAKLPLTVQAELLEKIISLTLAGEGGLEKLMGIVVRVLQTSAGLSHPKT